MVRHLLLGVSLLLLTFITLFSETDIDATLNGVVSASKPGDGDITSSSLASGNLTVKSKGSKYVKSQLTLDFISMRNLGILSISKAWIKFRYPALRVTLGKNRITWGEGAAFNAGDVIFDDYIAPDGAVESADLTADELRSVNRTLVQVIFPLGRFTYAEVLYLPYDFPLYFTTTVPGIDNNGDVKAVSSSDPDYETSLDLSYHSYGGRFVTKAAGMKLETGYIYNGNSELHKPYISINGTLGVDYHLSSSINITHGNIDINDWKETWKISSGSFYMFDLEDDRTLTLRFESLIKPFGDWDTDALMLYPEISLVPNEEIALFLRAIVNPIDPAVNGTLGLNWKTYQGFSIGSFLSVDIYNNSFTEQDKDTDLSLTVSVTHKF